MEKMYRFGIVGLGKIALHYKKAFEHMEKACLTVVSDRDEACEGRKEFVEIPFVREYETIALKDLADAVVISTPVPAHFEIAKFFLNAGIDVFVEKPMTGKFSEIEKLYEIARENQANLYCMFHWKYADEVLFLRDRLADFGQIKQIETTVFDDYAMEGYIRKDRVGLMGAWLDSGVNLLSYLSSIIGISELNLIKKKEMLDENSGLPFYVKREYDYHGISVQIVVDWRDENNAKFSKIETEEGEIYIDHMKQAVSLNGKMIYESKVDDRLGSHYDNMFGEFECGRDNYEETMKIHRVLFDK